MKFWNWFKSKPTHKVVGLHSTKGTYDIPCGCRLGKDHTWNAKYRKVSS